LELLRIETPIIEELQKIKTASYVVLDTELPKEGKRNARWSVQKNIDADTILNAINT
jgi:predicted transcriptional regulator of viral defense system